MSLEVKELEEKWKKWNVFYTFIILINHIYFFKSIIIYYIQSNISFAFEVYKFLAIYMVILLIALLY